MNVVGLLCGVGSLLFEAKKHGARVLGNVETRSHFVRAPGAWRANYDQPMITPARGYDPEKTPPLAELNIVDRIPSEWYDADLALGHPPCHNYSQLGHSGVGVAKRPSKEDRVAYHRWRNSRPGLMQLFVDLVDLLRPRRFALDNLPGMLTKSSFTEEWWTEQLPDYRLTFVHIVNWNYGSPQKRPRMWIIGVRSRKSFKLHEPNGRIDGPTNVLDAIRDLPWEPWIDIHELHHVHHNVENTPRGGFWFKGRKKVESMDALALGLLALPPGYLWPYKTTAGRYTKKPSQTRVSVERPCRVPTGFETLRHPLTGWGLTPRERARVMGWPDDFTLWDKPIGRDRRNDIYRLVMFTGRGIPSEFPRYLIPQLLNHGVRS